MNGRKILLEAIARRPVPRTPWLPFVGCHGASLLGKSATEYLKSADLIVAGQKRARELYQPDGLPVVFDLQIEAEALGCDLHWADDLPPCVRSHPLEGAESLDTFPSFSMEAARIPMVMEATERLASEFQGETALYGLITGPFTLATHLRGNDIFLDLYDEPEMLTELLDRCASIGESMARAYVERGCDVIAVVDPMTSQISPAHFEEYVGKAANRIFDAVQKEDRKGSFFVCGDARRVLECMFQTRCDQVCVDENIPLSLTRELAEKYQKAFGGNLKLTTKLLFGSESECRQHAIECLHEGGSTGFVLAPGCDLPFATPPKNLEAIGRLVADDYLRQVELAVMQNECTSGCQQPSDIDALEPSCEAIEANVPDYKSAVVVEVVTLDSGACPPCQYMVNAVEKAAALVDGEVTVIEHKVKLRQGIEAMKRLGVENIPTICVNGKVAFVSTIPDQVSLVKVLQDASDSAKASTS